jgi:transcription initiation factor TFIIH subunit 2
MLMTVLFLPLLNFWYIFSPSPSSTHCYSCQVPFQTVKSFKPSHQSTTPTSATIPQQQQQHLTVPTPTVSSAPRLKPSAIVDSSTNRFECSKCREHFCIECDVFAHDVLHQCPGCMANASFASFAGSDLFHPSSSS